MPHVIILGAKGRFGRAAVTAFSQAGWQVSALARAWEKPPAHGAKALTADVCNVPALIAACAGADVIVNAVNPPYEDWARQLAPITQAVIAAADATGATVLLPGNVYNYGADAPGILRESTIWAPTSRKGQLRVEMELAYQRAGVRCIVLRGGDYIEKAAAGNWFDSYIANKASAGRTTYPGPLDRVHAWAYLPDVARAAVMLAERRDTLETYEEFAFEGFSLTGQELVDHIEKAVETPQKISGVPWWVIRLIGMVKPAFRELLEMQYLWNVPHRMDGSKLARTLPDFKPTPVEVAFREVLAG